MSAPTKYCSLHPPGPPAEIGFLNFLELYPTLAVLVESLKQSEILCLMLTCKHVYAIINRSTDCLNSLRMKAIQNPRKERCGICRENLTDCVKCASKFHPQVSPKTDNIFQVSVPSRRVAYICGGCRIKLPTTTTSNCCRCDRSVKFRSICGRCVLDERDQRIGACEPFIKYTHTSEPTLGVGRARCQCAQCGKFVRAKDAGMEGGPVQVCRWCGKMTDSCSVETAKPFRIEEDCGEDGVDEDEGDYVSEGEEA